MFDQCLIGVVTKDRYDCLEKLIYSLRYVDACRILIDASDKFNSSLHKHFTESYKNLRQDTKAVVYNKNGLLRYFLQTNFKYLFILEDDIKILDPYVFLEYIEASETSNIQHLNFSPITTKSVSYPYSNHVIIHDKLYGAFQFFTKKCVEDIGLMNENLNKNCWEHVEYAYRVHRFYNYNPIWWHFPDYRYSSECIKFQHCKSSITLFDDVKKEQEQLMFKNLGISAFPPLSTKRFTFKKV